MDKGKPEPGKIYSLTGGKGQPSIMNGNTWAESLVSEDAKAIIRPEWDKMKEFISETDKNI